MHHELGHSRLAEVARQVRNVAGAGAPLEPGARALLEQGLGADLGQVRVHTSAGADRLAALVGAEAFAAGADLFFRNGRYRPDSDQGVALLAHEAAHTVQPPDPGSGRARLGGAAAERRAAAAAARVLAGRAPELPPGERPVARRLTDADPVVVRRHASWEHRLLGDTIPAELDIVATRRPGREHILEGIRDFLWMWHQDPEKVTEEMIHRHYPTIQVLRLAKSDLLLTYGELNTLPDYMANPASLDDQPKEILLPILQAVRQEGYNRVQRLLRGKSASFQGAVGINTGWDFIDLLIETKAVDWLTWDVGPEHTNHYTAIVGRNACHFAPYSWYRWQQHHVIARTLATDAHAAGDPSTRAKLTYQAWMHQGYADHFLEDSFAAGHLINKTLVMQWFIDWAAGKWYVPVADWDQVATMTFARQPGIAATHLYNPADPGDTRDPQTAEEQPTRRRRMVVSGVRADGSVSQEAAYQSYLAFLNSTVVQSASGALHDYFNAKSLTVASAAHPAPYQLWGDDTMLTSGPGAELAADNVQRSKEAIDELLDSGTTSITVDDVWAHFPRSVQTARGMTSLRDWHLASAELREQAFSLFPAVHYLVLRAFPRIKFISIDQDSPATAAAVA